MAFVSLRHFVIRKPKETIKQETKLKDLRPYTYKASVFPFSKDRWEVTVDRKQRKYMVTLVERSDGKDEPLQAVVFHNLIVQQLSFVSGIPKDILYDEQCDTIVAYSAESISGDERFKFIPRAYPLFLGNPKKFLLKTETQDQPHKPIELPEVESDGDEVMSLDEYETASEQDPSSIKKEKEEKEYEKEEDEGEEKVTRIQVEAPLNFHFEVTETPSAKKYLWLNVCGYSSPCFPTWINVHFWDFSTRIFTSAQLEMDGKRQIVHKSRNKHLIFLFFDFVKLEKQTDEKQQLTQEPKARPLLLFKQPKFDLCKQGSINIIENRPSKEQPSPRKRKAGFYSIHPTSNRDSSTPV